VTPSKLSRLPRLKLALALLTGIATSGALHAHADGGTNCVIGYPFVSGDPRTSVEFNESTVLRAFGPQGTVTATPGLSIKVWYNDEHALTLGVRRVTVKTASGTTTTDYPVSALPENPGSVLNPQVGTTALDGDQAGTDTSMCSGFPDLCDRPMFPALFVTDISSDPNSTGGDWQSGGTPIPPHAVFGTWKAAVRTVDKTKSPALVTVRPDTDPAKNNWNLGSGDPAPAGLTNEGYGAEVRWNVDDLVASGRMIMGHTYRLQFMVHDGDQNKTGGDAGENCVNVHPSCTTATDCDDRNPCTSESCDLGDCHYAPIPECRLCSTAADCDDQNACTTESCEAGVCHNATVPGCTPCTAVADCNDANACTTDSCDAGVCHNATVPGCTPCTAVADCNDANACTTDSCDAGVCHNATVPGCTPCTAVADCNDANACTTDSCDAGVCHSILLADCRPCTTAEDCDDGSGCTADSCSGGTCGHVYTPGCRSCATAEDCTDGNACTDDVCTADAVCNHQDRAGCVPCRSAAECDDQNPCTLDQCGSDGSCAITGIPGCRRCDSAAQCDDDDPCTTDSCTGGVCVTSAIGDCPVSNPPPVEICGNCIDDDGNGLTDFEDPACCLQSQTFAMTLKKGRLRPRGAKTRLRLGTLLAFSGPAVNPLEEDVFLQIRPEGGTDVFCAHIPAAKFMKRHGRVFKFWDRKHSVASARALDDMRIQVQRDGRVRLRTLGKRAQMISPSPGRLQVTVGLHTATRGDSANRCSTTFQMFRSGSKGRLLTP
jgi:Dictyostelium (slime mold) repeat